MLKKIRNLFIRISVSVFSLVLMFYMVKGELIEALTHLRNINLIFLVLAVVVNFLSLSIVTFRTRMILLIQKINLSFSRLYYLWLISFFFNMFLPSAVGGDIAKAYYIAKDSGKKFASVTSVLLDRFFGMIATISIGFFAYLLGRDHIDDPKIGQVVTWAAAVVFIGLVFVMSKRFSKPAKSFFLKFSPPKIRELIARLFDALDLYRNRRIDFFLLVLNSLVAQAFFIFMVYVLAKSIHINLPVAVFFLFMPLITLISIIPSIGGLGVREAATVYLFKEYVTLDQAVALSLIFDLFVYGIGCACGILYAIRGGASIQEIERIEKSQGL